jgi:DNA-binding transcriptional MerR regulator
LATAADEGEQKARASKAAAAFRTTGEAALELDVPAHVLRFWESKFSQVRPLKRSGGRRYYRPEDIDLLRQIRQYLYQEGYTIRGVQQLLRQGTQRHGAPQTPPADREAAPGLFAPLAADPASPIDAAPLPPAVRAALDEARRELMRIRALLDELLKG